MENAAIPLLNCVLFGAFVLVAIREINRTTTEAIKIREEDEEWR